jgi:hypothetical protein
VLAVGARYEDSCATGINGDEDDDSCEDAGAVYLFRLGDDGWYQEAYIKAPYDTWKWLGNIAINGNGTILAVAGGGAVDVVTYGDSGWLHTERIEEASRVALDSAGDTLVVSGYSGLYVFRDDGGMWTEQAVLPWVIVGAAVGDLVMDPDGTTIAVSFLYCCYGGRVDIFQLRNGDWNHHANVWKATPIDPESMMIPISLAISADGEWLAVGVRDEHWGGPGFVDLYRADGQDWSKHRVTQDPNSGYYDEFGSSVTLSADGQTLAVGAIYEESSATGVNGDQEDNSAFGAGAVYVY